MELFSSIFEFSQKRSHTMASRNAGKKINALQMGDNKRKHLVWRKWVAELMKLREERQANVSRLDRELISAEAALAKFAVVHAETDRETRRTPDISRTNADRARPF